MEGHDRLCPKGSRYIEDNDNLYREVAAGRFDYSFYYGLISELTSTQDFVNVNLLRQTIYKLLNNLQLNSFGHKASLIKKQRIYL